MEDVYRSKGCYAGSAELEFAPQQAPTTVLIARKELCDCGLGNSFSDFFKVRKLWEIDKMTCKSQLLLAKVSAAV